MSASDGSGMRARKGGDAGQAPLKELSVIVPTYNETENIRPLCERLFKATKNAGLVVELLIVDDESEGSKPTEDLVKALASEGHQVRIHCRKKTEGRGLSSAVLLGFSKATYQTILCMDADLQHEPESVPDVAGPVLKGEAEFTIGSRNVDGGGVGFEWSAFRRLVSFGATMLAWFVAKSTDPMSGFFCTRKEILQRGINSINPIGFKIALEVMVRCECNPVRDVAITFRERNSGESKLSAKQYKLYVEQLASLYWAKFGIYVLLVLFVLFFLMGAAVSKGVSMLK
eukprot:TRINITY_DN59081_c0_g1_i1.p1 TRINITY_DN59081_c0_g1~~TRINITY_DN59081_c0_g1_i1.p1  ORF type:complete len:286 (+),score=47.90 TRINITY_DN59081_c0_g1_i1:199-1056(+)